MSEEITPALTPAEWREAKDGGFSKSGTYFLIEREGLTVGYTPALGELFDDTELPTLIALANAALPDTDPRKIRRADVARLRAGASHMTEEGWRGDDERDFVLTLATKLASLLPPEGA